MIKKLLDQLSLCSLVLTYWTELRSFELKMPLMKLALKSQSCQKLQWSLNLIKLSLKNSMRALNTCLAQLHSRCKMFRPIFCAQMTKPQDPWILSLLILSIKGNITPHIQFLLEHVWVCLSLPEFVWICLSLSEFAWVCLNLLEFVWICLSLSEFAWVCLSLLEF